MKPIKINEAVDAVRGELISSGCGLEIRGVNIDTRQLRKGDLFIAIKGERVDGHDLLEEASNKGAVAAFVEKDVNHKSDMAIIKVNDTVRALQDLAAAYRKQFTCPVVAVTGSSGKTTTKDLIKAVLSSKYETIATKGNKNNHIGLPLTVFDMNGKTQSAVLEMGMSGLGEIRVLAEIADPDIAVITNIGTAHLEQLKTRENILKAKAEIFSTLDMKKTGIINGDDDMLVKIKAEGFKLYKVGVDSKDLDLKCMSYHTDMYGIKMRVVEKAVSKIEEYRFRLPGIHNVYNCLDAIAVGKLLGLNQKEIQLGLDEYLPGENRMDITSVKNSVVINDSYNANPGSMKSALDVLKLYKKDDNMLVAVLGDMFEIGPDSETYHRQVGAYAKESGVELILTIGEKSRFYNEGAEKSGLDREQSIHFEDKLDLLNYLKSLVEKKAVILIKGSRGMKMEEYIKSLN
jgi:UDP-N-acetylmuramoyl-tripeptide--D-alanyl-D-alanine ligase